MEMQFKNNLRALRKKAGITQKEVAAALGVALSTVAMWETGCRQPDYETLNKIADYYGVSYNQLLSDCSEESERDEDEVFLLRDLLRTRPEMKMLFSVSKGASKEDIERAVAIIEALKSNDGN